MKRVLLFATACCLVAMVAIAFAQGTKAPAAKAPVTAATPKAGETTPQTMPAKAADGHVTVTPNQLTWGPAPPVFEPQAQFVVVSGDPSKPGPYTVRLKMPAGYKIMPHWHPTDENVTVIEGKFSVGMGDEFQPAGMKELPAGGYALLPAQMHHYAMALTAAIVQVHGMGPFALTYVNPSDDPSKRASAASK